jgi:hypothetical protein
MWFKKRIRIIVYRMYLRGIPLFHIAQHLEMSCDDIDEIIDFMNERYA